MQLGSMLALAWCVAAPLAAQEPTLGRTHTIHGVVFDSVSRTPLAGAEVHVALRNALGRPFTTSTDSAGQFRIVGLPSGQYLIDFNHEVLGALGLEAPLRAFSLERDALVNVDIGVPSGAVVRSLLCRGDSAASHDGMLAGFVRDARDPEVYTGATVAVEWKAIALDRSNFRTVTQRARAPVGADGAYRLCGLPPDMPLDLRVTAPGRRAIAGYVQVPSDGVARQDIRLADSAGVSGPAHLRGIVMHENGRAVTSGRAILAALGRDVPVDSAGFVMADLPPGTWVVEVRSIGLEPRSALIESTERGNAPTTVTLDNQMQQLDAVTIIGTANRDSKVLSELLLRQRTSFGSVFLPGNPVLQNAIYASDVLAAARGFSYRSHTEIYGRAGGNGTMCATIAVYLNGMFFPGGFDALDEAVPASKVLAIEAYPDIAFAPPQWRMNRLIDESQSTVGRAMKSESAPCAVVVVWTRY